MGGVYRRAPMGARTDARPTRGRCSACALRSERLVLRLPTDDDLVRLLALAKAGIHRPGEMPFGVAWSTLPSPAFERGFMQHHWRHRAALVAGALVPQPDGRAGRASRSAPQSIDAEEFAVHRTVHTGSWLGRAFQGRGFGKEMRAAVLALRVRRPRRAGRRDRGVPRQRGLERRLAIARLRAERVRQPRPGGRRARDPAVPDDARAAGGRGRAAPVAIEGLDACREMFGV